MVTENSEFNKGYDFGYELGFLFRGMLAEGERSAVVVGAARVDLGLERLLKWYLNPPLSKSDSFFDPDRPAGSLSAKIALAYRLGLIDREVELSLQLIRKIRNDFAHSPTIASLTDSNHASRVRELANHSRKATDIYDQGRAIFVDVKNELLLEWITSLWIVTSLIECVAMAGTPAKPDLVAAMDVKSREPNV